MVGFKVTFFNFQHGSFVVLCESFVQCVDPYKNLSYNYFSNF